MKRTLKRDTKMPLKQVRPEVYTTQSFLGRLSTPALSFQTGSYKDGEGMHEKRETRNKSDKARKEEEKKGKLIVLI